MCPFNENFARRRTHTSSPYTNYDNFEVIAEPRLSSDPHDPKLSWEDYASKYLQFTDQAPTVYHAIDYLSKEFEEAGFTYLSERDSWDEQLSKGTRFYTTRNGTSFVAFVKGKDWKPSQGAGISGTHTDSLTAILKPSSKKKPVDGYELLGVAPYAGGLGPTWWDRDLGLGGRLVVKKGSKISTKLVKIPHPVARIPTLAPHFGAPANGPFNLETQAVPIVGLTPVDGKLPEPTDDEKKSPLIDKHSLRLLRALSKYSGVAVSDIIEFDLQLYDTQPASLGGLEKEFVFCPRIDDKVCTYVASHGLIESASATESNNGLSIVAGYDNEEVGSLSRAGARGNLLESVIDRILAEKSESTQRLFYANSFFVSADVIHAVNPNFDSVYLEEHKPQLNVGVTLSRDPNGNMITDAVTSAFIQEVARRTGNKVQQFQIRNDSRSGGTIGPALASKTGLRGADLGVAQLSMHSIRATMGSKDVWLGTRFFKGFYEHWAEVDAEFKVGDL